MASPAPTQPKSFYSEGSDRAQRVEDLFGVVAPRYDLINDLQSLGLHRLWKRRLIRLAAVKRGELALDLCCGTGDIALRLRAAGAEVIGVDFSEPMLRVAQGRGALPFLRGDALRLPFRDQTFDVITIGYGLRNLSSTSAGLQEMHRVLKPGGRMLVLDFGKPPNALLRTIYFAYLRWLVPVFGKICCGNSATHGYILESLLKYSAQQGVAQEMEKLGCTDLGTINLFGGTMSINYGVKRDHPGLIAGRKNQEFA